MKGVKIENFSQTGSRFLYMGFTPTFAPTVGPDAKSEPMYGYLLSSISSRSFFHEIVDFSTKLSLACHLRRGVTGI